MIAVGNQDKVWDIVNGAMNRLVSLCLSFSFIIAYDRDIYSLSWRNVAVEIDIEFQGYASFQGYVSYQVSLHLDQTSEISS